MKRIVFILSILLLISCENDSELIIEESDNLIGYWVNPIANNENLTFEKVNVLKDNDYGFAFHLEHKFIERKITGWCGTPPVSYADYEGKWTRKDAMINISVGYWGGIVDYQWKIISIDENQLTIVRLKTDYQEGN